MGREIDPAKIRAANAAANLVESGMVVGLGTGSTATLMLRRLGERVELEALKIVGVPTSVATAELARDLGIPLRELDDVPGLDLNLDGADEVDPQFRMIKGRGGALLREKIVACVAARRVTIITEDKRVDRLGANAPIPVEVSHVGLKHTERRIPATRCRDQDPTPAGRRRLLHRRRERDHRLPVRVRDRSGRARHATPVGRRSLRDGTVPGPVRYPRDRNFRRGRTARNGHEEESRPRRLSRAVFTWN